MARGDAKPKRSAARIACAGCGAALLPAHKFCPNCGAPVAAASASAAAVPASGPSLQVGAQPADALEEQRKVVTVMFADISGSTPLTERLDPEEMRAILGRHFGALAREIQHFGGTIDKYIGDAVMAVFGAPVSHEDDAERAVSAAMAMREAISRENDTLEREHGVRLSLRIGVNTGEVVAGLLAGEVQGAYTVVGDAVNTAQRLESAAQPNTVLVGEATYRLARRSFSFQTLPPVMLKGKAQPVANYCLIGRERRAAPREGPPLVGREAELARLGEIFQEVTAGRGQIVHLSGEAGVGKTRLVNEFLSRLPVSSLRLRGRCTSYEIATPYALVADLVRRLFRVQRGEEEARAAESFRAGLAPLGLPSEEAARVLLLELLGYEVRSALDPQRKRQLLASVLRLVLRHRASATPLVVTAEDVHWIDEPSAAIVAEVVAEVPALHCLVIATSRDEKPSFVGAVRFPVAPLDAGAAGEMVDEAAGHALDPGIRALVLERTGGNPFFIEEVARALSVNQAAAVPTSVQDLLEARLDALDPTARRVARRAAVVGRSFWERVLAKISPGERVQPALAKLETEAFVVPLGTKERMYAFRHALLQEVAYGSQLIAERRRLHRAVGDAIVALFASRLEEFTDLLAFHFERSDDGRNAVVWLVRAGDRARRLYANQEALALYRAALPRAKDGEAPLDAGTILESIGDLLSLTGKYDEAIEAFESARTQMPTDELAAVARLYRKIGNALLGKGEYPAALASFEEGFAALAGKDDVEAARIGVAVGQLHYRRADYEEARRALTKAIARAQDVGAEGVVAEGLRYLGNATVWMGDLTGGLDLYARSRQLYEKLEDLVGIAEARNNTGTIFRRMGRWDEALAEYKVALELRGRVGYVWGLAAGNNNIGEVYRSRGEPEAAIPYLERAIEIWESIGSAADAAGGLMNLGAARAEAGHTARGRADLLAAEKRFSGLGKTSWLGLYRYLASAELAAGNLEAAQIAADKALEVATSAKARGFVAMAQRVVAEVALARGRRDEARRLLDESRQTLAELGEIAELGKTEAVLQRL